jgi:TRAP-type mannitol/chloroaromatic compound transport system permease small subunit
MPFKSLPSMPNRTVISIVIHAFITQQNRLQNALGRWVAWGTISLVFITALVVVLRYGFATGSIALQEAIMYNHALLFMLGIAYTYQQDKHVRVDIFYVNGSVRYRAWVNLLGTLLFTLPVMGFILWAGWDYVAASWSVFETSTEGSGIAYLYLLKSVILVMAVLVALQGIAVAAQAWLTLLSASHEQDCDTHSATDLSRPSAAQKNRLINEGKL